MYIIPGNASFPLANKSFGIAPLSSSQFGTLSCASFLACKAFSFNASLSFSFSSGVKIGCCHGTFFGGSNIKSATLYCGGAEVGKGSPLSFVKGGITPLNISAEWICWANSQKVLDTIDFTCSLVCSIYVGISNE